MFRVLEVGETGPVRSFEGPERVEHPPVGVLRWIDLRAQDETQLEVLRTAFDFHPLTIEDCAHFDQRPKSEEYDRYLFVVTQNFGCGTDCVEELEMHELHTFLGGNYLVTVHTGEIPALEQTWKRMIGDATLFRRGPDFAYYLIADGMVDDNFPILDKVADELEGIEDSVLTSPRREDLERIFALKHHLVAMRKVLSPQRDVMGLLAKRGDPRISERTALYLRDVYDHLARINESIEANRDLLGNALDAYLSSAANRTNEIMKYLTLMSAVFLPLSFVVGFFGQNFDDLPGLPGWTHSDPLMYGVLSICVALPIFMVWWFKHRKWL